MRRAKGSEPIRQLKLWIGLLCIAWGFLGFIAGTWFGTWRMDRGPRDSRSWYGLYADRFAREFGLSAGQKAELVGYLADYHQREQRIQAEYALEMERREGRLTRLGWSMTNTLLKKVLSADQRKMFIDRRKQQGE